MKLALVQMRVDGGDPEANLARAAVHIKRAAGAGAQVALLPECMDLGWTHPSARELAGRIPDGWTCETLRMLARENRIYLCSGIVERGLCGAVYNSAVLIGPDGEVLLTHRKLNELEIGHEYYALGDRLNVCQTEFGGIGLMICADAFARDGVLARSLGYMGAQIILSPSAWAVPTDFDNTVTPYGELWDNSYAPVCREFGLWIAGVSNVGPITAGPWQGRNCIGSSRVCDPEGNIVKVLPFGADAECIKVVDITPVPRPARGCGWETVWREGVS